MEQSKSYNRPGGYSTYGAGATNVTVVDLLAQILKELEYQNQQMYEYGPQEQVLERDGLRCRRCRRMVDLSYGRGPLSKAFLHVAQEVGPPYVLLCRSCHKFASGGFDARREVIDAVGTRPLGAEAPSTATATATASGMSSVEPDAPVDEQGPEVGIDVDTEATRIVGRLEFNEGRAVLEAVVSGQTTAVDVGPASNFLFLARPHIGYLKVDDKLADLIMGDDSVPESSSDTPEPPDGDDVTHYSFVTPAGRPFLSRMLCDLAGSGTYPQVASSNWARVTCPQCHDIGADTVIALHCMSNDALVSLGALATQDEASR